jgi:hypothetical protein
MTRFLICVHALTVISIVLYLETIVYLFFAANAVVDIVHKPIFSPSTFFMLVAVDDIKRYYFLKVFLKTYGYEIPCYHEG